MLCVADWMLKTDQDLDGVPLSYIDMMERTESEERRREREKQIMREGKELWQKKKQEEEQLLFRDLEELKELSRAKMFGRLTVELLRGTTIT